MIKNRGTTAKEVLKALRHITYQSLTRYGAIAMRVMRKELHNSGLTLRNKFLEGSIRYKFIKSGLKVQFGFINGRAEFLPFLIGTATISKAKRKYTPIPVKRNLGVRHNRKIPKSKIVHNILKRKNVHWIDPHGDRKYPYIALKGKRGKIKPLYIMRPETEYEKTLDWDKLVEDTRSKVDFEEIYKHYWDKKWT